MRRPRCVMQHPSVACRHCGAPVPVSWPTGGRARWCTDCMAYAAGLRDQGVTCREVAMAIGASGAGAAFNLVERYRGMTTQET
jgi:hypothetical protein